MRRRNRSSRGERRGCAGRVGRVKTDGRRVASAERLARVPMFIVNFDELNFGELLEVEHQRERDGVERAIRLTTAYKIHVRDAVGKCEFAIAIETIKHEGKSLVAFDIAWTLEIFIEHRADQIL